MTLLPFNILTQLLVDFLLLFLGLPLVGFNHICKFLSIVYFRLGRVDNLLIVVGLDLLRLVEL